MISCWVLSSSSRPAGQARAAGERRQAHGHRRASQRHSPGSRGRKQDEAGCYEGQGCRRRQQQLPRQILKVFRSFQAAGDAPPPAPSSLAYMHFTLPCAPPCPLLSSPHTCPLPPLPLLQQNEKKSGAGGEGGGGAHMPVKHSGTAAAKPAGAYKM